ncbi:hypothetical protein K443DRAFT_110758, partial [Laccaria amethystina LaAM-08-1]
LCSVRFFRLQMSPLHITKFCSLITKVCSVRFFRLQKFVVSPFVRFFITKICSLRFFRLQNFVVSAFFYYKICSVRFFITKVCGVRFFTFVAVMVVYLHLSDPSKNAKGGMSR